MYKVKFKATFPTAESFKKFEEEFQTKIIENGLDDILKTSLWSLKKDLRDLVNKEIRNVAETPTESAKKGIVNIPKSDETILKEFVGLDIKHINTTKSNTSDFESKTTLVQYDKKGSPYVRMQIPVSPGDTIESQFVKAREYFNAAMFVNPQRNGHTEYLINSGFDLTEYTKIWCSTDKGVTEGSAKRLEHYKEKANGVATWTLTQEGVKKLLEAQKGFTDISNVVDAIKEGDIATAKVLVDQAKTKNKNQHEFINNLDSKLEALAPSKIDKVTNVPPSSTPVTTLGKDIQSHKELINLINDIYIEKSINSKVTIYSAVTNLTTNKAEHVEFFSNLQSRINLWVIDNEEKWVKKFTAKVRKLLRDFKASYRKINV